MRRTSLALSTLLATAGCWSLAADLDLTGGEAVGASDAADAAATPGDGAADGGLCDRLSDAARVCDDFDVAPLGARWTRVDNSGTGTSLLGDAVFASAPRAFVARAASGCAAGDSAQLVDIAPGSPAEATIDFDLSIAPLGAAPGINLVGILYEVGASVYRTDVAFRNTHLEVTEGPPVVLVQTSSKVFPFDEFAHLSVTFTFAASPRVVVKVNGAVEIDRPLAAPPPTAATTKLDLGIYVGAPCQGTPVEARFDDFVYRLRTR